MWTIATDNSTRVYDDSPLPVIWPSRRRVGRAIAVLAIPVMLVTSGDGRTISSTGIYENKIPGRKGKESVQHAHMSGWLEKGKRH